MNKAHESEEYSPIQLDITPHKSSYFAGELVEVFISIRNTRSPLAPRPPASPAPEPSHWSLSFSHGLCPEVVEGDGALSIPTELTLADLLLYEAALKLPIVVKVGVPLLLDATDPPPLKLEAAEFGRGLGLGLGGPSESVHSLPE